MHTILAGLIFGSMVMLGVCCWHLLRGRNVELFRRAAKLALIVAVPATLIQLSVGNRFGEAVTSAQGMKIAASEAQWNTCQPCGFSLFQIGGFSRRTRTRASRSRSRGCCRGWRPARSAARSRASTSSRRRSSSSTGAGNYMPHVGLMYWSMRVMAMLGRGDVPRRRRRGVAVPQAEAAEGAVVPVDRDRRDRVPVHRRDRRLDPDRDGPPAVDRAGPAEDLRRRLAEPQHGHDRDQPERVRRCCTSRSGSSTSS